MLHPIFKITTDQGLVFTFDMRDIVSISYDPILKRLVMASRGREQITEIKPVEAGDADAIIGRYVEVHGEGTE